MVKMVAVAKVAIKTAYSGRIRSKHGSKRGNGTSIQSGWNRIPLMKYTIPDLPATQGFIAIFRAVIIIALADRTNT